MSKVLTMLIANVLKHFMGGFTPLNKHEVDRKNSDQRMGLRMQLTAFLNANLGIVLLIIGIATDHWAGRESSRITIYEGLWQKCTEHHHHGGREKFCRELEGTWGHEEYKFTPVLVFLFLACALHLIGFIMSIVLFCRREYVTLEKALAAIEFFVLIFTIVGLSIYATTFDDNYYALKWSSALGWGSTLCMLAAFVFTLIDIDRKK